MDELQITFQSTIFGLPHGYFQEIKSFVNQHGTRPAEGSVKQMLLRFGLGTPTYLLKERLLRSLSDMISYDMYTFFYIRILRTYIYIYIHCDIDGT